MIDKASRHKSVMDCQSFPAIASLGKSLDPIPTQVTPALNPADRFSSVGSTAPVAMIRVHGMGAAHTITAFAQAEGALHFDSIGIILILLFFINFCCGNERIDPSFLNLY